MEERFGAAITTLQQQLPSAQAVKRVRLLRIMERFGGDVEQVRKFLEKCEQRHADEHPHVKASRREQNEELKTKYATQLAELTSAGVNVNNPCVLRQLDKFEGDANKVRSFVLLKNSNRVS